MVCSAVSPISKKPTFTAMRNIVAIIFFTLAIVQLWDSKREDAAFAQNSPGSASASKPEMASHNASHIKKTEKNSLVREGTVMQSQHVIFRVSNDRVILTMVNGTERYICLENLNLQRITDVIKDNPTMTDWTVDFIVTEYRGMNYALIQRAVLASIAQRADEQK